ncbi:hypothetical protein HRW23_07315 [Streptomyces lunaelactis]|uniref:Rv1733c family protein n=2 Tax=Streptomyces lunaelactis TaxID=1535768 RepID=UPI0015848E42|nr:hypothetical protein [Streptomyces lunaelactis]NUK33437.1 hypothetical protein [Streptomyces lunaelactis]NUK40015.1 hypothetical protein [Streptomyces lunaelactis]NUK49426.1 hypothetical protein [Streptomyces lunaelactis]NUK62700.1 hypothetical protein [Streptomyces lunaelactis]NUK71464.1 hypothetical protein [Streptomyces lunaelactis]
MRAAMGVWRWRHNPLRRATDLLEAWVALVAALLLITAAPAVGWISGAKTDDSLRQSVRIQRQQRHAVIATVLKPAPDPESAAYDPESAAAREKRRPIVAKWTAVDGSRHSGTVSTALRTARVGDTFTIWTDRTGRVVHHPMDLAGAKVHAVLAGMGAALASAGLVECARALIMWRLVRRRHARLDRAWAAAGPDWGRTGAGS